MQKNQHIHVAIKLQHILETDDKLRKAAGLPRLDIPEHLWGVQDMQSAHTREQDFMAITAEVEVLCQQLKGKGMYTVPSATSTTSSSKSGSSVHFQTIDPAQKSSVQAMDQSLLNSSLNLLDHSPRSQSSSSNGPKRGSTQEGTTHSGSTQDKLEPDKCTVTKTGTIATIAGQHATAMTAFHRCATGTCKKPSS